MITIEANYAKKIGLPGYSSHQFSLTVRAEVADPAQVPAESARLYKLLQENVDTSIKESGYFPPAKPNGNGHSNGNGNGAQHSEAWACSPKQQDLILRIVEENKIDKNSVETLAQERFGKSVRALNKLEASGLIEELFGKYPGNPRGQRRHTAPISPGARR